MVNLTVDSVTLDRLWQEAATSWNTVGASGFDGLKLLADALDDNGLTLEADAIREVVYLCKYPHTMNISRDTVCCYWDGSAYDSNVCSDWLLKPGLMAAIYDLYGGSANTLTELTKHRFLYGIAHDRSLGTEQYAYRTDSKLKALEVYVIAYVHMVSFGTKCASCYRPVSVPTTGK